jgi:hypothetical protein
MDNTFENHSAFNRHMSIDGNRLSTDATKPSIYISCVKLRRAVKELSDIDVEEIFENEMSDVAIKLHREKLITKIERLMNWQVLAALDILLIDGNFDAIVFVSKCKRTDKKIN